jgi:hypothetical protein
MGFVQVIDMHTDRWQEPDSLEDEWRKATDGKRTLRRSIITRDRKDPNHYVVLAFFDDYDSAMVNSNLPETGEFGARQQALLDQPIAFLDLDIIDDQEG